MSSAIRDFKGVRKHTWPQDPSYLGNKIFPLPRQTQAWGDSASLV